MNIFREFFCIEERSEMDVGYSEMRGFNYQPSYGSSGSELWQNFNRKGNKIFISFDERIINLYKNILLETTEVSIYGTIDDAIER
jgi:hypothetical protein